MLLAAGHLAVLVLLAATARLFWRRCRLGCKRGSRKREREGAQQILGFHVYSPDKIETDRETGWRGGGVGGSDFNPDRLWGARISGPIQSHRMAFRLVPMAGAAKRHA
jgi:hypothetical protein